MRMWGGAPNDPTTKGQCLFGEQQLTQEQQEMLRDLSQDARANTRGILQSLVLPEYVHKQQGMRCPMGAKVWWFKLLCVGEVELS